MLERTYILNDWKWWATSERGDWRGERIRQQKDFSGAAGFGVLNENNYYLVMLPHWILILLIGLCAAGLWIGDQFSLKTLLVVVTLFVGVIGTFGLMVMMKG